MKRDQCGATSFDGLKRTIRSRKPDQIRKTDLTLYRFCRAVCKTFHTHSSRASKSNKTTSRAIRRCHPGAPKRHGHVTRSTRDCCIQSLNGGEGAGDQQGFPYAWLVHWDECDAKNLTLFQRFTVNRPIEVQNL